MLFNRKSPPQAGFHDVMEGPVVDASIFSRESDVSDAEFFEVTTPLAAPAGQGLFVDQRPPTVVSLDTSPGLRAKFLRKAIPPPAPVSRTGDETPSTKAKSWRPFRSKKAVSTDSASATGTAQADPSVADAPVESAPVRKAPAPKGSRAYKKPVIVKRAADKRKPFEMPIRVYIGFLPEVTERDARDYALGIAERNCEQISICFYDAFRTSKGYAYEIHEGGAGRAFLPEIIAYFANQSAFVKGDESESIFIRTATRTVQVDRTLDGIQAFLLPEDSIQEPTDWLVGTTKMSAAIQTLKGLLVVGAVLFTTGFMALTFALVSRIQPYDEPLAPVVEKATDAYNLSPLSRWTTLQGVPANQYVKALRFAKGKWELENGTEEPAPAPDTPNLPNN